MLAGTPLSYWAGVRGKNPMRYLGGTLGGTWLTALAGDMGEGIFDGANLVANFESLNPANTYWTKPYNVYSKVDTETERFLEFETWWGSPVLLNAGEMQWIADNLFVGNKLATGEIRTSEGVRIDLRNIRSPIVCFCSWGDDITPPQQALGLDPRPLRRRRARSSPTVRRSSTRCIRRDRASRHLRLGQSGVEGAPRVRLLHGDDRGDAARALRGRHHGRRRGHGEPRSRRRQVSLPARATNARRHPRLRRQQPGGRKAFCCRSRACPRSISALYHTFAEPWIRAWLSASRRPRRCAPCIRTVCASDCSPTRIRSCGGQTARGDGSRRTGRRSAPTIRCSPWRQQASSWITTRLENAGEIRDSMTEAFFLSTYGSPILQAMVGLGSTKDDGAERSD